MGHSALQWLLRLCVDYHISSLLAENLAYHPLSTGLRSRGSQGVERELSPGGAPKFRPVTLTQIGDSSVWKTAPFFDKISHYICPYVFGVCGNTTLYTRAVKFMRV